MGIYCEGRNYKNLHLSSGPVIFLWICFTVPSRTSPTAKMKFLAIFCLLFFGLVDGAQLPSHAVIEGDGTPGSRCVEQWNDCNELVKLSGCHRGWMLMVMCPKACGLCDPCGDKEPYCEEFAKRGDCIKNPLWMNQYCNKSCLLC